MFFLSLLKCSFIQSYLGKLYPTILILHLPWIHWPNKDISFFCIVQLNDDPSCLLCRCIVMLIWGFCRETILLCKLISLDILYVTALSHNWCLQEQIWLQSNMDGIKGAPDGNDSQNGNVSSSATAGELPTFHSVHCSRSLVVHVL